MSRATFPGLANWLFWLKSYRPNSQRPKISLYSRWSERHREVIMGVLSDSAATFDTFGQCILLMQEQNRRPEKDDDVRFAKFSDCLHDIGYSIPPDSQTSRPLAVPATPVVHAYESASPGQASAPAAHEQAATDLDFLKDKDLLKGFIDESSLEHLESIEANLLELEQNPEDHETINTILRPFHTIKGVSEFLNLKSINKLAHATENLLDDVRNARRVMDSDVIDVVPNTGDFIRKMIENIKEALEKGPSSYRAYDIDEYLNRITWLAVGTVPPGPGP